MLPKRARRTEETSHISGTLCQFRNNRRMVSSVGWESAGLLSGRSRVQTPAGPTLRIFKQLRKKCCLCNDTCKRLDVLVFSAMRTKNHRFRLIALLLIWFLWDVKGPKPLFEKSRGRRPRWWGQPFLGWVGYL